MLVSTFFHVSISLVVGVHRTLVIFIRDHVQDLLTRALYQCAVGLNLEGLALPWQAMRRFQLMLLKSLILALSA